MSVFSPISRGLLMCLLVLLIPTNVHADPAPVSVHLHAAVTTVVPNQLFDEQVLLTSSDPTPVSVEVTVTAADGLAILNVPDTGDCSTNGEQMHCTLSVTDSTTTITLKVQVRADVADGTVLRTTAVVQIADGTSVTPDALLVTVGSGGTATSISVTTNTTDVAAASATTQASATIQPSEMSLPTSTITTTTTPLPTSTTAPSATTAPSTTAASTPTATLSAAMKPDACEQNDDAKHACTVSLDAVNGPYTIVPDTDQDFYTVDLGTTPPAPTTVFVRATQGLDLITTITRVADGAQVATISSPTISTTLGTDMTGLVLLHVENRNPKQASGETYRLELRRTVGLLASPTGASSDPITPDALENNWDPPHATDIGVNYAYDLTFACPVAGGCPGGDYDYFRITVKSGVTYLLSTFDLGPGVDTTMALFWGSEIVPVLTSDDTRPGFAFLSTLQWTAPSDGEIVVGIFPRTGGAQLHVADQKTGSYRFAIALANSPFGQDLRARIDTQTFVPTPTVKPTLAPTHVSGGGGSGGSSSGTGGGGSSSAPAPAPRPPAATAVLSPTVNIAVQQVSAGVAVVIAPTTPMHLDPDVRSPVIRDLPQETIVKLAGKSQGLWVQVSTTDDVLAGWVLATDLRRVTATLPTAPVPGGLRGMDALTNTTMVTGTTRIASQPSTTPAPGMIPEIIDPAPLEAPPQAVQRVPLTLLVQLTGARAPVPTPRSSGQRTPTSLPSTPLGGLRVQLVTALGDVLAEAVTPADGRVTLQRDLDPQVSVWVRVPQAGVLVAVPALDEHQPSSAGDDTAPQTLTIAIAQGGH